MRARSAYFLSVIDAKLEIVRTILSASEFRFITTADLEAAVKDVERMQHLVNRIWETEHESDIEEVIGYNGGGEDSTIQSF